MKFWMALFLLILAGCSNTRNVEVFHYKGQKLDGPTAFQENSIKGPQHIDISKYKLEVFGLIEQPRNYTYSEIKALPSLEKVVTLHCVEGWDATVLWRGAYVADIIGKTKSGANTVIFYAVDGYSTSLPLEYITKRNIILAYEMNNATLLPERGFPFQLVSEDKWGYKWIKWVTKIEVSNNASYTGYWESRGYSNSGDLSK